MFNGLPEQGFGALGDTASLYPVFPGALTSYRPFSLTPSEVFHDLGQVGLPPGTIPPATSGGISTRGATAIGVINAIGNAVSSVTRGITGNYQPEREIVQVPVFTNPNYPNNPNRPNRPGDFSLDNALQDILDFASKNLGLIAVVVGGGLLWKSGRK